MKKHFSLSIVAPCYNEEKGNAIGIFFNALIPELEKLTKDFEIICVDDGSKDRSYDILCQYAKKDKRIKVIRFARNFGKEIALSAGFRYVSKDCAIPMDMDLQDPVELIPQMVEKWQAGAKTVLAKRTAREGGIIKRFAYIAFHRLMKFISDVNIPENTGDFRLVDRQLVDEFNKLPERERYVRGLWAWVGFPHEILHFKRPERVAGEASQSFKKLFQLAGFAIFSMSRVPLKVWSFIGVFVAGFSFLFGAWIIFKTLYFGADIRGYPSLMVAVLFMGGIQLLSVGILGEYIGRIYAEVKQRPLFVVSETKNIEQK
ncbi:MAG: glycosyltransferase family 2 protein [Alphaproteobacteria bacterium]|nr:glycosyltransferase family 2 protein [Alphaproteobacteria bacterium]